MLDQRKLDDRSRAKRRPDDRRLDERKAAILTAVVEKYIETAQPVGSGMIAGAASIKVSPATVRNEMASLETDGYLVQPHTSAGRVPTEKAYRYFVDSVGRSAVLPEPLEVGAFFRQMKGELEHLMRDSASLLSRLTEYAAVVVDHSAEAAVVRALQLVQLAPRVVLVVVVLSNGVVHKHTLELGSDLDEAEVAAVRAVVAPVVEGRQPGDGGAPNPTGVPARDDLAARTLLALGSAREPDRVYVDGASRVADSFEAVESVKRVLSILEQQLVVVSVLTDVLDRGLRVAIGTETGEQGLEECSVVVAPYEIEGERAGTIAVLGPTRMHYPQAMAAVAAVSRQLGQRLSEGV